MKVTLDHHTPLHVCAQAIRQCWQSHGKSDSNFDDDLGYCVEYDEFDEPIRVEAGPDDKDLIDRIGNKKKHASTLEHLYYNFTIEGISRACLQELARHRIASLSVKSSRYTLKELKNEAPIPEGERGYNWDLVRRYCVMTEDESVDNYTALALARLQIVLQEGKKNDLAKYCMPEAYKTSLAWSVNARSLQNFLTLRTSPAALWEIRDLAKAVFDAIPEEHKYLFEEAVSEK